MKLKLLVCISVLLLSVCAVSAADNDTIRDLSKMPSAVAEVTTENKDSKVQLRFDTRIEGMYNGYMDPKGLGTDVQRDQFGFAGRYVKLLVYGNITNNLSYSFRYRLNTQHVDPVQFFSTIDWLNLNYDINDNFFIAGGKQMIYIGGWEYDLAPIDMHFASKWWNNTPSIFAFGISGGYHSNDKNHTLILQVANSQFSQKMFSNMFAYSLSYYGNIGVWKSIYSVNFFEYEKGKFINYIALGNKFDFGKTNFYIDWTNRAGSFDNFFSNFSLFGRFNYMINDKWLVFAKGGYEQNLSQLAVTPSNQVYDRIILPGTQEGFYGAGVEYTPLVTRKHALRLHAYWHATTADHMPHSFNIGIKWQMNVIE